MSEENRLTLIDTSAWIEFFKNREPLASQVDAALADGSAALCGIVELELVAGLREGESLLELLSAVQRLETIEEDYLAAGLTLQSLRRRGITPPVTDGLIAQLASRHDATLIARDKHFEHFAIRSE